MKRTVFAFAILLFIGITTSAQTTTNAALSFKTQAEESLKQQNNAKASAQFKRAYELYLQKGDYPNAIWCGVQSSISTPRESIFKESFDFCREMESVLLDGETKQNKKLSVERFLVMKARLDLYSRLKMADRSKEQLGRMEELSNTIQNDSIKEDMLYTKAQYYFTFGPAEQGIASYNRLITAYKQSGNQEKVNEYYKNMITLAERVNNASVVSKSYKAYIAWTDSIKAVNADNELVTLTQKYDTTQKALDERESELSIQGYKVIALCVVSVVLLGALIFLAIVLLRFLQLTRKQKKNIEIANEHNELKSQFIRNISEQMEPALNTLAESVAQIPAQGAETRQMEVNIEALRSFSNDIQELSHLEHTLTESYKVSEVNANTFCEGLVDKIRPVVKAGVEIAASAPKIQVKTNPEQLERILMHLLENAAFYTTEGKISLEFKKRGAHTVQYIVTDTGEGVPAELQANLFKPFTEIKDLTQGDGLGLPICSLIATKLNGKLTLDTTYTKGSRFILELHV